VAEQKRFAVVGWQRRADPVGSSGWFGSLEWMTSDEQRAATVRDPSGHEVVLPARIWDARSPELVGYLDAVIDA
jgi:hypothetical protein